MRRCSEFIDAVVVRKKSFKMRYLLLLPIYRSVTIVVVVVVGVVVVVVVDALT